MKKWIADVAAALRDKLLLKLFFYKQDREMAKARKKLRLSKVTQDRIARG
jgi:hypothetical protein